MENNYVKCIKIVHYPAEVRVFRILSAFFRFIGIFACENLVDDEYGDEVDWTCRIEKGSEDSDIPVEEQAKQYLLQMKECFGDEPFQLIMQIWPLFLQNDLMRGSYAIDYFSTAGKEYIYQKMETAMASFESALCQLEGIEKNLNESSPENVYLWMAEANCQRRINELAMILWKAIQENKYGKEEERETRLKKLTGVYIAYDKIESNIAKVLKVDPSFYAAYAIRGFAKELSEDHKIDSVNDFEKAIDIIGNKSYNSYLNYRKGSYYEKILHNSNKKMEYYEKAVKADRHNYRAIYKLAKYEQEDKNGNLNKAIELWENLLNVLLCKENLPSLQPIECAYLYKAYRELGLIYKRLRNYTLGIEYLEKAIGVYDSIYNEDNKKGFYPWMFGNESVDGSDLKAWEIYKNASRKKLNIQKTYTAIVDASSRAGLEKIHDKYINYIF